MWLLPSVDACKLVRTRLTRRLILWLHTAITKWGTQKRTCNAWLVPILFLPMRALRDKPFLQVVYSVSWPRVQEFRVATHEYRLSTPQHLLPQWSAGI